MLKDLKNLPPMKTIPLVTRGGMEPPQRAATAQRFAPAQAAPRQLPVELGPPHRRELPESQVNLLPKPLSAFDDNPVLDEIGAARFVGVSTGLLKKWRQRNQGPDYIQYGTNGVVRYELKTLMQFREIHRRRGGIPGRNNLR
jgi:hypothetical protein